MQQEILNQNTNAPKKITSIDFNCDLAQSFGVYKNENEYELLDYVTSVNISTGFHAGDPVAIKEALVKAGEKNLVIAAHIGFDDIQGFGKREVTLTDDETEAIVIYQVGALMSFANAFGFEVEYVRPHGAMYKMASENFTFSCAIAKAIKKCSKWLTYMGAAGDVIEKVGTYEKLPIAQEINLANIYNADGTIDYKAKKITDSEILLSKIRKYLQTSQVNNNAGGVTVIKADSMHFSAGSLEVLKQANQLITPKPVNYAKVEDSGWV